MTQQKVNYIALLTDGIHPLVMGGMQKHSFNLLKSLVERNVKVLVYHPGGKSKLMDYLPEKAMHLVEEVVIPFPKTGALPGSYLRQSYLYALLIADDMKQREQPQFIYAQGFTAWALLDRKRKGEPTAPIGVNFHGLEMFQSSVGFKQKLIQWMFKGPVKFNLRHADRVYSLGGKLTEILKGLVPEERIAVVPIAVDQEWLAKDAKSFESKKLSCLFIGRYERRKGLEELNAHIEGGDTDSVHYHFIGPIPGTKQVRQDNVSYHGKIMDTKKLIDQVDQADVLLVPSVSEGMPTVILEGMARGLIIVASDVGAVADQVDDKNGVLLSVDDRTAGLGRALAELQKCTVEQKQSMSAASIQRVEDIFLWNKVIDKTLLDISTFIPAQD